ncbi:methyl-accepting chemotaxis protein [Helicobacter turcicus]|uniref:Methyl-accepting transducer domain-containing protein n=1 Tax=Helicobacter turcicus TaxID=2867412 RepID=A0ABS7JN25_9HELI|nr:methyl-accepting chemotaxis protein [Helicobacter turcicus]MBX7490803.1 hypothetical protein [Helicobacter turcicus]MBX7545588.1 hypothetical protein [Helicobacter turcicus]
MTLKTKVTLVVSLVSIVGFTIFGVWQYLNVKEVQLEISYRDYQGKIDSALLVLDSYLLEKQQIINGLSKQITKHLHDEERITNELELSEIVGGFNLMYFGVESTGRMLRSNRNNVYPSSGYDPRKRSWFSITKEKQQNIILSDAWMQASKKIPVFGFSAPIFMDNTFYGVVSGDIALKPLNAYIKKLFEKETAIAYAVDSQQNIVVSPNENEIFTQNEISKFLIAQKDSNRFFTLGDKLGVCKINTQTNWKFCLLEDKNILYQPINAMISSLIIKMLIFAVFLIVIINIAMSKLLSGVNPIKNSILEFFDYLNGKTQTINPCKIKTNDELGTLAKALNENILITKKNLEFERACVESSIVVLENMQNGNFSSINEKETNNAQLNMLKNHTNSTILAVKESLETITKILEVFQGNDFTYKANLENKQGAFYQTLSGINNLGSYIQEMLQEQSSTADKLNTSYKSLQNIVAQVKESSQSQSLSAQQSAQAISAMTDSIQNTASRSEEITQQANNIRGVVGTIKDIADQTNLLALNAAIEAARAGEHGRGFAVVADEVRKLAESTQKSLGEIEANINLLAQSMNEISSAIQEQTGGITQINESIQLLEDKIQESKHVIDSCEQVSLEVGSFADNIKAHLQSKKF